MFEEYNLVFTHNAVNEITGERVMLDEPISVTQFFYSIDGNIPIALDQVLDEMKIYILKTTEMRKK